MHHCPDRRASISRRAVGVGGGGDALGQHGEQQLPPALGARKLAVKVHPRCHRVARPGRERAAEGGRLAGVAGRSQRHGRVFDPRSARPFGTHPARPLGTRPARPLSAQQRCRCAGAQIQRRARGPRPLQPLGRRGRLCTRLRVPLRPFRTRLRPLCTRLRPLCRRLARSALHAVAQRGWGLVAPLAPSVRARGVLPAARRCRGWPVVFAQLCEQHRLDTYDVGDGEHGPPALELRGHPGLQATEALLSPHHSTEQPVRRADHLRLCPSRPL
mmetsp:Transcript_39582/g.97837  ORF Transcript_39582/g.97837 Transcript_39582/m.97837 type:complete len:272 (-) Transcript_39582:1898-2713(-)